MKRRTSMKTLMDSSFFSFLFAFFFVVFFVVASVSWLSQRFSFVFVFGSSLNQKKKGFPNHRLLHSAIFFVFFFKLNHQFRVTEFALAKGWNGHNKKMWKIKQTKKKPTSQRLLWTFAKKKEKNELQTYSMKLNEHNQRDQWIKFQSR